MSTEVSMSRVMQVGNSLYARLPRAVLAAVGWKRRDTLVAVAGDGYVLLRKVNMAALAGSITATRKLSRDERTGTK